MLYVLPYLSNATCVTYCILSFCSYEGDELPVVGNEYIFFAYAQPDGSLLISGPVSNMSVSDNTSDIAPFSDSTEYSDIVDAYNNQVDSGRTRFTSSYEAK